MTMLNVGHTSEPVMFGREDPIGMVEWFATARDRQGLEMRQWHSRSFYRPQSVTSARCPSPFLDALGVRLIL